MTDVELHDGSRVEIRALGPDDKAGLAAGFERLSEGSRYRRFLSPTPKLTTRQLAYLTEVDHHDHEALVAIEPTRRDGVGVARYVRSQTNLDEAEFAVAVADDWQRLGVGTALLRQLATRAREEGISWFTGLVLAHNESMLRVLAGLGHVERRPAEQGALEVRLHLPDEPHDDEHEPRLARWMHVAAIGELESRLRHTSPD
jgi:GNAT superfamily N-acetyltransferase